MKMPILSQGHYHNIATWGQKVTKDAMRSLKGHYVNCCHMDGQKVTKDTMRLLKGHYVVATWGCNDGQKVAKVATSMPHRHFALIESEWGCLVNPFKMGFSRCLPYTAMRQSSD
jgi:hypothetical protein